MTQASKPKKIVSKSEYVQSEVKRGLHRALGIFLIFVVLVMSIGGMVGLYAILKSIFILQSLDDTMFFGTRLILLVPILYVLIRCAKSQFRLAKLVEEVIPITKANRDQIPQTDSLLRFAQHQENSNLLLRSQNAIPHSVENRAMSSEELLRPDKTDHHPIGYYEQPQSDQTTINIQIMPNRD